jgi:hypothetical protein
MKTPAHGLLRWVRSAALAVATVGLAATAHTVAGGDVPGWAALGVLTLLTVLACVALTGRRRGVGSVGAAMTGLQVVLHEGFMVLSPMGCGGPTGAPMTHAGMHGTVPATVSCVVRGPVGGASHLSVSMLAAHGLATLLLAAALAGGERALWRLRHLVAPSLPLEVAVTPEQAVPGVPPAAVVVPTVWTSVSSLVRRGPPSVSAVVPC